MRFAELYPTIPLQSLVREVLHTQNAVARNADNRAEIVEQMVTTRLARFGPDGHRGDASQPTT